MSGKNISEVENGISVIKKLYPNYTFLYNNETTPYRNHITENQISKLCGDQIEFSIPDLENIDDNTEVLGIVINESKQIVGILNGYIEDDDLINDITECASGGAKGIGEYLRYFCLLKAHLENQKIVKISGGIAGGIPLLHNNDSPELEKEKKKNY